MAKLREGLSRADDGRLAAERAAAELRAQVQDFRAIAVAADAARVKVSAWNVGL